MDHMLSSRRSEKEPATMLSAPSSSTSPPFLQSPNAIPPRRSSTGHPHQQHFGSLSMLPPTSSQPAAPQQPSPQPPIPPIDQQQPPVPPARRHHHTSSSSSSTSANANKAPMLRSVPEGDWISTSTISRRSRKPSITMISLTGGTAAGGHTNDAVAVAAAATTTGTPAGTSTAKLSSSTVLPASASTPPPPPDPLRYASEDFNFGARNTWTEEKEQIVRGPFDYLNGVRGKEFRTQLINAFNGWLEVPAESLAVITRVVGMLHTASLLVDDVEDGSSLRRGLPVAHNIFGVAQAINSANYVYFVALQELQKLRNPRALTIFAEELCNLHRGQGMDLFWRDTLTCPTEDDYLEMVGHKTGGLFRLGIKLMQAESRSLVDCVPLVNVLGLLFQIQDDYRNLMAPEYSQNKGLCEDLTEGKFSFPVIHSIRSDPANLQLLNILKQKTSDEGVKRYAVSHMERTGSFAYTRQVLAVLTDRARSMADALDEGKGRSRAVHVILDKLAIQP